MKVFVTGVAGFLGSHIAEAMLVEGHEVCGIDNFDGGDQVNIPEGVEWLESDCVDTWAYEDMLQNVDVVYHCAALPHEGLSVFSPQRITESIFGASVAVFTAAIKAGVKRIVYTSSMSRYGANPIPFTEEMYAAPRDPYAIAKVAAEDVLKCLCEVHGVQYVIAVPHNIIGPRQKYDDPYRNVAAIMINRIAQDKPPIIYGDGTQVRCFSDIRDVIPCFVKMATQDNVVGEVINVGPDEEPIEIRVLAQLIQMQMHTTYAPIHMLDRPCEVKHATCSAKKARSLLEYQTKHTINETVASMVEWVLTHGAKPFQYHVGVELPTEKCPKTWTEELI